MRRPPRHLLSEIDEAARRAVCAVCGPVALKTKGFRNGRRQWRCRIAWEANNRARGTRRDGASRAYRWHLKGYCERAECTATIEHLAQLEVHHRDGDSRNNDPGNLITLCANCHRLTHALERESPP